MVFNLFGKMIVFKLDKPTTSIKKQKKFIKTFLKHHHTWNYKIVAIKAIREFCGIYKDSGYYVLRLFPAKNLVEKVVDEIDYENNRIIKSPSKKEIINCINKAFDLEIEDYVNYVRDFFCISLYKKHNFKIPKKLNKEYLSKLINKIRISYEN